MKDHSIYYTVKFIDPYVNKERECNIRADNEEHAIKRFGDFYKGHIINITPKEVDLGEMINFWIQNKGGSLDLSTPEDKIREFYYKMNSI